MIELLPHDRRVIGQFHEDRLAAAADAVVQAQADVEPVGLACQIERVAVAEGQYGEFLLYKPVETQHAVETWHATSLPIPKM